MNSLDVNNSSLVGSTQDILALKNKSKARLLVLSDSHGNANIFNKIVHDFGADCDVLVFCGDGICDLINCLETAAGDLHFAKNIPPVVLCVRGNGDAERYVVNASFGQDDDVKPYVKRHLDILPVATLNVAGRTAVCVHGHRHSVDFGTDALATVAESSDADMVFFGHTHRVCREENDATLILNPGSCSRPRGGFPPTFAVVSLPGSTERYDAEFFEIKETLFGGISFAPFCF